MPLTYVQAVDYLYSLRLFGAKLGLDNTRRLASLAGNPQDQLRFLHVAGTNGKGSTCAMLESIYRGAGFRVGLFTSPHLVSFRERLQINRQLISESDVVRLLEDLLPLIHTFPPNAHPTFFEVVTILALRYFAEQGCELVIWETGLGGRLDATNIVMPEAALITNIALDHEKWLGQTLPEIASEKAGIIKPNRPVVTGTEPGPALDVIRRVASEQQAPLTVVPCQASLPPAPPGLPGEHQRTNAALAQTVARLLQPAFPVSEEQIQTGLRSVQWPGRLQILQPRPGQTLLLDGAHNPSGTLALRDALQQLFPQQPKSLLLGLLRDKDSDAICHTLAPLFRRICLTPFESERSTPPESLAPLCRQANPGAHVELAASPADALQTLREDPFVVVAGSLHLLGAVLQALGLTGAELPRERLLNEYHPPKTQPVCP